MIFIIFLCSNMESNYAQQNDVIKSYHFVNLTVAQFIEIIQQIIENRTWKDKKSE